LSIKKGEKNKNSRDFVVAHELSHKVQSKKDFLNFVSTASNNYYTILGYVFNPIEINANFNAILSMVNRYESGKITMDEATKKIRISITLNPNIIKLIDDQYYNKSKFIEECIIEELSKNETYKNELKNKNIIL
jgi:dihydroxyacetone kinase-like predicted kinase